MRLATITRTGLRGPAAVAVMAAPGGNGGQTPAPVPRTTAGRTRRAVGTGRESNQRRRRDGRVRRDRRGTRRAALPRRLGGARLRAQRGADQARDLQPRRVPRRAGTAAGAAVPRRVVLRAVVRRDPDPAGGEGRRDGRGPGAAAWLTASPLVTGCAPGRSTRPATPGCPGTAGARWAWSWSRPGGTRWPTTGRGDCARSRRRSTTC